MLARAAAREHGDADARRHGVVVVSSVSSATKRPTKSVTSVLGAACEPPIGSCEITMPSEAGSAVSSRTTRVRKPAFSSVVCAMETSWVVTSGTAAVDGPLETDR